MVNMALTLKERTALRDEQLAAITALLETAGYTPRKVANGAVAVKVGGEALKVEVSVPTGPKGGNGWDADAEADAYEIEVTEKAEKAAEKAEAKAKKIAADEAKRAAKAAQPD